MKNWLLKPFPFVQSFRQALLLSVVIGFFVTGFLYVFKPFEINEMGSPLLYLSGYGLISFWVSYFALQIQPIIISSWFNHNSWNVWKNILFMIEILLLIALLNWIYGIWLFNNIGDEYGASHIAPISLIKNIGMTFSVGIFPILMANYILERQLFAQNTKLAQVVTNAMSKAETTLNDRTNLEIPTDGGISVIVSSKDLLCVKAEGGNYVTVFWNGVGGEIKKQLWRITLKNLLSKIESDQDILQCHKSYLVNRAYITEVTGNARTLVLRVEGIDFEIPVSRNFPRELVEHYRLQQA